MLFPIRHSLLVQYIWYLTSKPAVDGYFCTWQSGVDLRRLVCLLHELQPGPWLLEEAPSPFWVLIVFDVGPVQAGRRAEELNTAHVMASCLSKLYLFNMWPWTTKPVLGVNSIFIWFVRIWLYIWLRYIYLKIWNLRAQKKMKILRKSPLKLFKLSS